ncbi:hypothetical protein FISHEDRAFT_69127 [Fistulina hepatica ATCC 64428]|uniref:DUF6534 domain-containing protein n=1 Tax=Fistulina hepatica ATCC 64428 TaxID=1128425 RepID=A0A0D7AN43_9AGAR|nr:hypothetical protein FISHEDRAFT_69127 [Fistulina hepatica ATCC 64428]
MLGRLLIMSVNTETWTALCAVCAIILYKASSDTIVYIVFDISLSPLYANTLLMNLNARNFVRDGDTIVNQTHLSFIQSVSTRTARNRQLLEPFKARSGMQVCPCFAVFLRGLRILLCWMDWRISRSLNRTSSASLLLQSGFLLCILDICFESAHSGCTMRLVARIVSVDVESSMGMPADLNMADTEKDHSRTV